MSAVLGYLMVGLIRLMGLVPLGLAQRFGNWLGDRMMKRRTRTREVARLNIAMTYPHLSAAEQQQLVHQTLRESGKAGAEMGVMWGAGPEKGRSLVRTIHQQAVFTDAIASGRGVLLCVPHLGNWEVLNHVATQFAALTAMYSPAKNAVLDRWMLDSREKTGGHLVPTSAKGVRALLQTLKQGGVAGILPDQEPDLKGGVFAPFMGVTTLTPKLPVELLKKTGAVAVFAFAERLPDAAGFDVHFIEPDAGIYSDDSETAAAAMNRTIERCVAVCPAQYQWTYKRFRKQPDGVNPYKEAGVP